MNQTCKVCGEPAAGFHFGAFTCEGCKSFFGRSYNNLSSISECKNNGKCVIDKKNRTTCKACRLRKCYTVGMSKGGSRYGRRSNWFKIHCLLQEQQQQAVDAAGKSASSVTAGFSDMAAAAQQHLHQRSSHFASHMGGLLSYPGYLHEMLPVGSTFHSQSGFIQRGRGGHEATSVSDYATSASAMPFFMMNSLPMSSSTHSAFHQLPPHLLFPGYHSAAVAADAYARNELQHHRKSVDSSDGSHHRWVESVSPMRSSVSRENTKLSADGEDVHERSNVSLSSSAKSFSIESLHKKENTPSPVPIITSVTPSEAERRSLPTPTPGVGDTATVTLAAKIQSLSPVSICSISAETRSVHDEQDIPMDLSMKTQSSRSSVQSFNTGADCDLHSEVSEEDIRQPENTLRRKFYHIAEHESSNSSYDSSSHRDTVKRQKLAETQNNYNDFGSGNNPTSMRGIFVCV